MATIRTVAFATALTAATAFRESLDSSTLGLDAGDVAAPARARSALLTSCIAGGARYFPRSQDQLFDGLDMLLFTFKQAVGGDMVVFTMPEPGAEGRRTIHDISHSYGATVYEVSNTSEYHGYAIPTGSISRHVHYLEWVAAEGHAYDHVYVADCTDVAFQSDPMLAPPVAHSPAEAYLFLEPNPDKAYRYFERHASLCYTEDLQKFVTPELQVNSGFWMATPSGVGLISERIILEAVHCGHYLWDQHYLNVVVHARLHDDPRVKYLAEQSLVATMAKTDDASAFAIDRAFMVRRSLGNTVSRGPYAALHQYNWHEHLVLALSARKAGQEPPPRPARRPKIYVYDGTADVNGRLREAYVPSVERDAWTSLHSEFLAEVRLHEGLLAREEWLTSDPGDADLFFVPCYAWLALQCTTKEIEPLGTPIDACALQKQLAVETVEMLRGSRAWQEQRPHVFVHGSTRSMEEVFPHGLADLVTAPHAVVAGIEGRDGDTRVGRYQFKPHDIVIPYDIPAQLVEHVNARLIDNWNHGRWKSLRLAMHASPNHPIRRRLLEVFSADPVWNTSSALGVQVHALGARFSKSTIQATLDDLADATFCLAPRGITSGARRFYEAIMAACIPVALGDQLTVAYSEVIPELQQVVVFWPEGQVEGLTKHLQGMAADEITHRQRLMLSLRYRLLLEVPSGVRWGGVDTFLLALARRAGELGALTSDGAAEPAKGPAEAVRRLPAATPAKATLAKPSTAPRGAAKGRSIALLTLVTMPDEHSLDGASAAESPSFDQILDGVLRLLGSLHAVDPAAQSFVLASRKFLGKLAHRDVLSRSYNATVLPFEPRYRYRGMDLRSGNVGRHLAYRQAIERHLLYFSRVVIVDSKDVIFQAPLGQLLDEGADPQSQGQVFAFQEPVCAQIRAYWEQKAAACYKPSFYTSLPDSAIMNGGVLAGAPRALMAVSSLIAEEALKCLTPTSFLRDQHYLDAVLWSISNGLLRHEDATSVHYARHGTRVVNCNHPKDAEMKVDSSFRVHFKQDNGSWRLPVALHQYTNRENLLRAVELRIAELREPAGVRVCAYPGAAFDEAPAGGSSPEGALCERWRHSGRLDGAECDLWFVPLCGTTAMALQDWAEGLLWFKEHPRKHVFVEPSAACAAREGVGEVLATLRTGGAIPIYAGGEVPQKATGQEAAADPILAPFLLPPSHYEAAARELAARLTSMLIEEDLSENKRVVQPLKDRLLLDVEHEGGLRPEGGFEAMARSSFCLLPSERTAEWLTRAVLSLCVPVLRRQSSLPFEDLFSPSRISIFWAPSSLEGLEKFLARMPAEQLLRMQAHLAEYRVAFHLKGSWEEEAHRQDVWETVHLALHRRWLALDKRPPAGGQSKGRFAYFVSPFDARYVAGACRLLQSLAAVGTQYPVVVFLVAGVDIPYHSLAQVVMCGRGLDLRLRTLQPYTPFPDGDLKRAGMGLAWTRIRLFEQDDFDRVLQLEVDQVVQGRLDGLFGLPFPNRLHAVANCNACEALRERPRAACLRMLHLWLPNATWDSVRAVLARKKPDGDWERQARADCKQELQQDDPFNAGVLLYRPDRETMRNMMHRLRRASASDFPYADQDLLNEYFDDWLSLPEGVNAQVREATAVAPRSGWSSNIKLLHWPGSHKPWAVDHPWRQLASAGLPPSQLAWFGEGARQSVGSAGKGACSRLQRLLLLTCATATETVAYQQWRSLVGQPSGPSMRVLNVCADSAVLPSTGVRASLYRKALGALSDEERQTTLAVTSDSYDVVPNWIGLSQQELIETLVQRVQTITPSCDKVVYQAEFVCYIGRPCTQEEARQFYLRRGAAGKFGGFPNGGLAVGRAMDVHAMLTAIEETVALLGLDMAKLRDQPLVDAYYIAMPDAIVLDDKQLIAGSFQTLRLNPGGGVEEGAENVTEQCHAYKNGSDLGPFVCASTSSPREPCCLKTAVVPPRLLACRLFPPQQDTSVEAPLFVHGQGPYKAPCIHAGAELLKRCTHDESLQSQPPTAWSARWWLIPAALLLALCCAVALIVARAGRSRQGGEGDGARLRPALIGCSAYLAFTWITYGVVMGLSNATMSAVVARFNPTPWQEGLIVGCPAFVMALAAQPAGYVADRLGRCHAEQLAAFLIMGGSLAWAAAGGFYGVFCGRFLLGLGLSAGMVASQLHAAEIAPSRLRGALCSSLEVFVNVGILSAWLLSMLLTQAVALPASEAWPLTVLASGALALLSLPMGWLLAKESPRWLLQTGSVDAARATFCELLSSDAELEQALSQVETKASSKNPQGPAQTTSLWQKLRMGRLWKPLLVSTAIGYLHHGCGIGILVNFSNQLLAPDFGAAWAERVTVTVGVVKVLALFPALLLVDRLGRKPLLAASLMLMGASYAAWALQAMFTTANLVTVTLALAANVIAFSFGVGPLNYVVPAEVWPQEHRNQGVAIAMLVCRMTEGIVALLFMPLLSLEGGRLSPLLWGFASVCVCGSLFFLISFTETKQQALESNAAEN